jgi:hypothetical protein
VHRDAAFGKRQCDTTCADTELECGPVARKLDEEVDDGLIARRGIGSAPRGVVVSGDRL